MPNFSLAEARDAFANESLTAGAASAALTASVYEPAGRAPAQHALITVETNDIRWRVTGADASATAHLAEVGSVIELIGRNNIKQFRFIRAGASDGAIRVTYSG